MNTYTTGFQDSPEIAFAETGEAMLVWVSRDQDGDGYGVMGRLYDGVTADGGPEFAVNTYTLGNQGTSDPTRRSLAVAAGGVHFVVVWSGDGQGGSGLFGHLFDTQGTPRGVEFRIDAPGLEGTAPSVAADDVGRFLVVWHGSDRIYGQGFDALGQKVGSAFQVEDDPGNALSDAQASVAMTPQGEGVVAWLRPPQVLARRVSAAGQPVGSEIQVGAENTGLRRPSVARAPGGGFLVAWERDGVRARGFDALGTPLAAEFLVATGTSLEIRLPSAAANPYGEFLVTWSDPLVPGARARARLFDADGTPRSGELLVSGDDTYIEQQPFPRGAFDTLGNFIVVWRHTNEVWSGQGADVHARRYYGGLVPQPAAVDPAATASSNGNGVLEACETVALRPAWSNATGLDQTLAGTAAGFAGPPGATYTLTDGAATYGLVPPDQTATCGSDCYEVALSCASTRPATHWDATLLETLSPLPQKARRPLHIGDSFMDVPRSSLFYPFVETALHHAVTGGCAASAFCPAAAVLRQEAAVFLLVAKEGPAFTPRECFNPAFPDVPASSPFCAFISALDRRAGVAGCGNGNFCPSDAVTRAEMAVLVLSVLQPQVAPPPCGAPLFNDVPAASPFCPWIEELARRGVVAGCGAGAYCPGQAVTRAQMSVFVSAAFGLTLYSP